MPTQQTARPSSFRNAESNPTVQEGVVPTEPWPEVDWIDPDTPITFERSFGIYCSVKPTLEWLVAVLMLPIALPLVGIAWLMTKLSSHGPGFYFQTRSSANGQPYQICKIRTMYSDKARNSGYDWATKNDTRITTVGKILRLTHLDEIPQLWNVLRGEMSLVGPRPERPEVIHGKNLCDQVPGYGLRLMVKPGVTGLAQIQLPADSDITSVRHKIYYDMYYLANQSLFLDLKICIGTVLKIFLSPDALRYVLFLPSRQEVTDQFLAFVFPSAQNGSATHLQPA